MGGDPPDIMGRGQGAIEFVLITTVMMLLFTGAFIVAQQNYANIQESRFQSAVYGVFDRINSEIRVGHQAGAGYTREFSIPKTLAGTPYTLELLTNQTPAGKDALLLRVSNDEHLVFLEFDVDGVVETGKLSIAGGSPVVITTAS